MSKKGFNTFDLNDEFWDIDEMLPKKKIGAVFSNDTDTVEIQVNSQAERKGAPIPKNDGWQKRLSEMRKNDPASPPSPTVLKEQRRHSRLQRRSIFPMPPRLTVTRTRRKTSRSSLPPPTSRFSPIPRSAIRSSKT